ncbi:hypothetical protein [Glaciimonas immobilis]|uniref:Uncharacterized protein n=1 Tax=Glaciimonas immobilis TaxID=728004 RepID=A0A840RRG4_9BURK|nr:hypothetical protein [Glaciimonas immobilis]KAF3999881.1 hypothetical protein HAV38_01470 [Glaciimonas immobilis]MBB5200365.1 hypothetical protein [Glaciimonas immobilis]
MQNFLIANVLFFVPMALFGMVLFAEVPVRSKVAHGGLCTVGLAVGALFALLLLELIGTMV